VTDRALFVSSQNRLRSPTAEQVYSETPGLDVDSGGLNHDATVPLTPEQVNWATVIFVMEKAHKGKLAKKFRDHLHGKKVVCLNIPDDYEFMDPALVQILNAVVPRHLPSVFGR
jgi:predicted protein tyrosine phosphatase